MNLKLAEYRTREVLGEKGRRIRELTALVPWAVLEFGKKGV